MEDLSEFLGWSNLVLFSFVVLLGLLLRFGKLKGARKMVSLAHRILTALAIGSAITHFLTVEDKPFLLVLLGLATLAVPLMTIVLKRIKKLSLAISIKLVLVPLVAIGLFAGHLGNDEDSENERPSLYGEYETDED